MCGCLVFIELRNRCLFQKCGEEGHQTVAPQVTGYNLAVFDKYGGSLGATGCVSYLFKRKGLIILERQEGVDSDDVLMKALESGAKDVVEEDDAFIIETNPDEINDVVEALKSFGISVNEYNVELVPDMYVELDEEKQAKFEKMIEALEDLDDVQNVYHNVK